MGKLTLIPTNGEEPHLLFGQEGHAAVGIYFDPAGRFLASTGEGGEGTIRLWPLPKGRPPLSRSHDEFLEYMRSQTNVRAVPDPEAKNGFRIEFEPFAGWDALPQN